MLFSAAGGVDMDHPGVAEIADQARQFFDDSPSTSKHVEEQVAAFVARHRSSGLPLVCVTSGGTTVPLERKCVRFIDNFSAGTRGAMSTEEFLRVRGRRSFGPTCWAGGASLAAAALPPSHKHARPCIHARPCRPATQSCS